MSIKCDYCDEPIDAREIDLSIPRAGINLDLHPECRDPWERKAQKIKGNRPPKDPPPPPPATPQ